MKEKNLKKFGFSFKKGSAHQSRTIMLEELEMLFDNVPVEAADAAAYQHAIVEENCLGKRTVSNRTLNFRYLRSLYALNPAFSIFRALRYFWQSDEAGHPMMALLCAYSRDYILRFSAPFILSIEEGQPFSTEQMEEYIENAYPDRFSKRTLKSTAQNINSSWTKSGHLHGYQRKTRSKAKATPGAVAYALFLSYLSGSRGIAIFETDYARLLDCSPGVQIELAEDAARKAWLHIKRIGDVIDVSFPELLTKKEMEWIREQNQESY